MTREVARNLARFLLTSRSHRFKCRFFIFKDKFERKLCDLLDRFSVKPFSYSLCIFFWLAVVAGILYVLTSSNGGSYRAQELFNVKFTGTDSWTTLDKILFSTFFALVTSASGAHACIAVELHKPQKVKSKKNVIVFVIHSIMFLMYVGCVYRTSTYASSSSYSEFFDYLCCFVALFWISAWFANVYWVVQVKPFRSTGKSKKYKLNYRIYE